MEKQNKPTISICTIVKNEENQVQDFLASLVDFADEINIVDTGSVDKTITLVDSFVKKSNNVNLYKYESVGVFHYGQAKNFSLKQATKDFIIVLDTDERLSDGFKNNIRKFLALNNPAVAKIKRIDESVHHLIDCPERIIKNNNIIFYKTDEDGRVHEELEHKEVSILFDYIIWHEQRWNHYIQRPQRILFQLELQIERTPKTKSFFGHILRGIWYAQFRFKKLYFKRSLYKDGSAGFKYALIRAIDAFLIEFFVGLKPRIGYKYWEDKKYRHSSK